MFASRGETTPALRCASIWVPHGSLLQHTRVQPLPDQTEQYTVTHPALQKRSELCLIKRIEETLDVELYHPAAPNAHELISPDLQGLVRRPTSSKPVRAVQKVLLVDRLE